MASYRQFYKQQLALILAEDKRYTADAYDFVSEAITYTMEKVAKADGERRHISGQELLGGIRELILDKYGPMAQQLLSDWGISSCLDFGHIVFNMVDYQLMGKRDEDSIDDFRDGYDFYEAFRKDYLPKRKHHQVSPIL